SSATGRWTTPRTTPRTCWRRLLWKTRARRVSWRWAATSPTTSSSAPWRVCMSGKAMKITAIDPFLLRIPFEDGGTGVGMTPQRWNSLEMVLVRIQTDTGLVGWGEAFGYFCRRAVAAVITDLIAPFLIGRDASDPAALNDEMQRRFVLFGRYGITIFGLSGVDIALWDLKAKAEGVSLAGLLTSGHRLREQVSAYASLVRYGQSELVTRFAEQAVREGYETIKLHETTMPEIRAGRRAIGRSVGFTVDVNCGWTEAHAAQVLPELKSLDTLWL